MSLYRPMGLGVLDNPSSSGLLPSDIPEQVRTDWWVTPPPGFKPFYETGAIDCPAPASAETTVLQFAVPDGYAGVIKGIQALFSGTGYLNGSDQLIWRFYNGPVPFESFGQVKNVLGSDGMAETVDGGLLFGPNRNLKITIENVSLITGGARIIGTFKGWYVPSNYVKDWQIG